MSVTHPLVPTSVKSRNHCAEFRVIIVFGNFRTVQVNLNDEAERSSRLTLERQRSLASERFKTRLQLLARCRAAVNQKPIVKDTLLPRGNRPIRERRNIRIDEALLVRAPAGRVVRVGRMIKNRDADVLIAERAFDIAPSRALLLTCAPARPV